MKASVLDITSNLQGMLNLGFATSAADSALYRSQMAQAPLPVNSLFDVQLQADGAVSVGFASNADPQSVNIGQAFRLDIVPETIEWKSLEQYKEWLQWKTKSGGYQVPSLYRSISEAIVEVKANSMPFPLYTYYLYFK